MRCIYGILNLKNNKKYIGSSSNFSRRKTRHLWMLENNRHHAIHLQLAYNKANPEDFVFIILEKVPEDINLLEREQYWLDYYNTYLSKNGYNCLKTATTGGINNKPVYQYNLEGNFIKEWDSSAEAARCLNKHSSAIQNAATGKVNKAYGFIWIFKSEFSKELIKNKLLLANKKGHSIETKEKMRNAAANVIRKNAKIVEKYTLDNIFIEEYKSMNFAAKENNISMELIGGCCKGKYKQGKGFIWKWKEENKVPV